MTKLSKKIQGEIVIAQYLLFETLTRIVLCYPYFSGHSFGILFAWSEANKARRRIGVEQGWLSTFVALVFYVSLCLPGLGTGILGALLERTGESQTGGIDQETARAVGTLDTRRTMEGTMRLMGTMVEAQIRQIIKVILLQVEGQLFNKSFALAWTLVLKGILFVFCWKLHKG